MTEKQWFIATAPSVCDETFSDGFTTPDEAMEDLLEQLGDANEDHEGRFEVEIYNAKRSSVFDAMPSPTDFLRMVENWLDEHDPEGVIETPWLARTPRYSDEPFKRTLYLHVAETFGDTTGQAAIQTAQGVYTPTTLHSRVQVEGWNQTQENEA